MLKILQILFLLFSVKVAFVQASTIKIIDQNQQYILHNIYKKIECVVCSGQSIDSSESSIAMYMRNIIKKQIKNGKTEQQVIKFLQQKYGDYILINPPFNIKTFMLWFLPAILTILVLFIVFMDKKTNNKTINKVHSIKLSFMRYKKLDFIFYLFVFICILFSIVSYNFLGSPRFDKIEKQFKTIQYIEHPKEESIKFFYKNKNKNITEWIKLTNNFLKLKKPVLAIQSLVNANKVIKNNIKLLEYTAQIYYALLPPELHKEYLLPILNNTLRLDKNNKLASVLKNKVN